MAKNIDKDRLRQLSPGIFSSKEQNAEPQLLKFEITESLDIHLYATVDGKQRRRVITSKNATYENLLAAAKTALSEEEQKAIIEPYFKMGTP